MFNAEKAAYNALLAETRKNLATLVALRKSIAAAEPATKGKSVGHLETALKASFVARTFDGYEGDLAREENPYAAERRTGRRAVAARR